MSDQDLRVARAQHLADGRLRRHASVNFFLLHRGDEGVAGTDADGRVVTCLQSALGGQRLGQKIGGRADARDAECASLEVGGRLDGRSLFRGNEFDLAGCATQLHDGDDGFALALDVDGVVIKTNDGLYFASDQFVLGFDTGAGVDHFDFKILLLEVAELFRQVLRADKSAFPCRRRP